MALANQIRIQQHGDAIIGEQTQIVYDEETGIVGQKKTMVAQVPTEDGGTAYVLAEHVEVAQVHPSAPSYTVTQRARGALPFYSQSQHSQSEGESSKSNIPWYCGMFFGCCTCLVSLAMIISIAAAGTVSCGPLYGAAVTGLILGAVTFLMSLVCCLHFCKMDSFALQCLCCSTTTILFLMFLGALIPNTVFVAENINFIYSTPAECTAPIVSVAVMGMSYAMLLLFILLCVCSCCVCVLSTEGNGSNL